MSLAGCRKRSTLPGPICLNRTPRIFALVKAHTSLAASVGLPPTSFQQQWAHNLLRRITKLYSDDYIQNQNCALLHIC
jgi:hypothetical protein